MKPAEFHYLIFIQASREQVWAGLTEPEFTREYWLHENRSGWQVGDTWEHVSIGEKERIDITGQVVTNEPGVKLELTWQAPSIAEPPSRVCFQMADQKDWPGGLVCRAKKASLH